MLCAGDRFITADALGSAIRAELGPQTAVVRYQSTWPDEPFGPVGGVREAAGDPAELAALASDVTAILTHLAPVTAEVITAAPRLRVVGVTRGGPVNADLDAATAAGVPVLYLPGRNLGAVAEFTVGVMIDLCRNVTSAARELAAGRWDARYFRAELTGPELRAATVGLVGLGAVGARVAQLLRGFGTRVLAYDPYASPDAVAAAGAEPVPLRELLAQSDLVSLHARLSQETRGMFGADAFAAMKPGARLINTARGELVDQDALLAALDVGQLAGAALDVFDPEPPVAAEALLARPEVIATPHLAGASRQVATESAARIAAEVAEVLRTGTITHCANPEWSSARSAVRQ